MAGVMPPLEPHHHVGAAGQPIDDLALAFVAPLGADDGHVSHVTSLFFSGPRAPTGEAPTRLGTARDCSVAGTDCRCCAYCDPGSSGRTPADCPPIAGDRMMKL